MKIDLDLLPLEMSASAADVSIAKSLSIELYSKVNVCNIKITKTVWEQ